MTAVATVSLFTQRIAAAWMDAARFADTRSQDPNSDDGAAAYWEATAARHAAQGSLVTAMLEA